MAASGTNDQSHATVTRPLSPGIYAPIPTFFQLESEDLDLDAFEKHVLRTALAGVRPLLSGSMSEAIHLSHAERSTLIKTARKVLDNAGLDKIPIVSGIGAGSTRECIELANEAADAGADCTIAICSGYFAGALAGNKKALKAFWTEISQKSPIPVMIYNYPGASGGINLDSDLITELAEECPNLVGVKLTCGDVGKLTRIAATVSDPAFSSNHPRKSKDAFLVLGGFTDFLLPGAYVNGHGAITGLANVAPHTIVKLLQLSEGSKTDPKLLGEAQRLQGIVARADATIAKSSIAGTKFLLDKLYGYGGNPRRPLPPIDPAAGEALWEHPHTRMLVEVELGLVKGIHSSV
ncbi:dihydrodipicolinate synthetase [Imleria badia]|nr:dihydrodipicolinate synthetase [Imleria badia]